MATIKSFTSLEQSRKLAEILPLESADMFIIFAGDREIIRINDNIKDYNSWDTTPVWSLAALVSVLPLVDFTMPQLIGIPKTLYRCIYNDDLKSHAYDNPVDACYEMILKLHELKML